MRYSTAILLASAGIAAAQTSTVAAPQASSTCLAQPILDLCLTNTQTRVDACQPNDWACFCDAYTAQLTCYDNCPGDPNRSSKLQQQTQYCNAARTYQSSSSAVSSAVSSAASSAVSSAASVASAASSAAAATGSASAASRTSSGSPTGLATITTGSSSASAAGATSTGAASGLVVPAGGLLAVALGLLGML